MHPKPTTSLTTYTCAHYQRVFQRRKKHRAQHAIYCCVACRHAGARTRRTVPCAFCGTTMQRKPCDLDGRVYCSRECCWADQRGKPANRAHKRRVAVQYRNGYRYLYLPEHPNAPVDGYIPEHRLVMSAVLGRPLARGECVHHVSGDRLDNRPENLQVLSPSAHAQRHRDQERARRAWATWGACQECGTTERRHAAHGLCVRCYGRHKQREYTRAQRTKE